MAKKKNKKKPCVYERWLEIPVSRLTGTLYIYWVFGDHFDGQNIKKIFLIVAQMYYTQESYDGVGYAEKV